MDCDSQFASPNRIFETIRLKLDLYDRYQILEGFQKTRKCSSQVFCRNSAVFPLVEGALENPGNLEITNSRPRENSVKALCSS